MKISIIGAGHVGTVTSLRICEKELANDVVLVDIVEDMPQGKALDIQEAMPLCNSNTRIRGTNVFSKIENSDIVVVTAGIPRRPGTTREGLLQVNSNIIRSVAQEIKQHAPNSVVIVVTNPLDIMAHLMLKETGFDKKRVIGMAGVLDTTRFRAFIALETGEKTENIKTLVIGNHGDSMVPVLSQTTINDKPIKEVIEESKVKELVERTRTAGGEIVSYLKTGSAYYAPAYSIVEMIESMIKENRKVLPCSIYLEGEYGYDGIFLGLPIRLGKNGVVDVVDIELDKDEKLLLEKSASNIKEYITKIIQ